MTDLPSLLTRSALPDSLRILLQDYPRTGWQAHENFNAMVRFWLDRHLMFRRLLAALEGDLQTVLDREMDPATYLARLSRYGGMLLNDLHGHHQIEDQHYFPRLMQLDARIAHGFDLLENDHHAMDGVLHDLAQAANGVLQGGQPGDFAAPLDRFAGLLNRHLEDEEDIIVPVILATGFDG